MAELTITSASGGQRTTQNPQNVPSGQTISGASTRSSSGVQPGISKDALTSKDGQALQSLPVTTISLDPVATTSTTVSAKPAASKPTHKINAPLLGISIMLVVLAIGFFWAIKRSVKNTTE